MRFIFSLAILTLGLTAENWPGWRGPRGDGTSLEKNIPTIWSPTKNIAWKTPIPGKGHASPVVWEEKIFLVTCDEARQERLLFCVDRMSGKILWKQVVLQSPLERVHRLNSRASSTPATDGERVYVSFLDQKDMVVAAYSLDGKLLWRARPGVFKSVHGYCSSPVIWKEKLIVNGDHDGPSYIVALDRANGNTLWKTMRQNQTRSYCVPTIFHLGGRPQMVLSGDRSVASYDPDTGKNIWYLNGPTQQFVASIVYNPEANLLFMTGGFPQHHIIGLKHDGRGVIDDSGKIMWHHRTANWVSYVPSPISAGKYFLLVNDRGFASCFDAKTGDAQWAGEKMSRGAHASLVSAEGLVYFTFDDGTTRIIRPGKKLDIVAENSVGEGVFASPAISQGNLFIKGDRHLFRIGK
ncbi:MAG: serine/threonine protein kinase [Verrucomicrobiales bacterium]|nr:serine/threonine protein kinase [Verrucomicrobiales bacterium]|tara:strand:+ start:6144 stop:7367 length:1224 start_codon:yes stop_codon:yes gene_type:complete